MNLSPEDEPLPTVVPIFDADLPDTWQSLGVGLGVYVRMPSGQEPTYLAGMGRPVQSEDIDLAIRFLNVVRAQI